MLNDDNVDGAVEAAVFCHNVNAKLLYGNILMIHVLKCLMIVVDAVNPRCYCSDNL